MSGYRDRWPFRVDVNGEVYEGEWVNIEDAAAGAIRRYRYKRERERVLECKCVDCCECAPLMLDDMAVVIRRLAVTE